MTESLMATNDTDLRAHMHRLDDLLHEVEESADPAVQGRTREIVQTLLEYHGAGLARILDHLAGAGDAGRSLLDTLAGDDLVSSMLLLYGLHPHDLETRVRRALDKVRPYLRSHGGNVELVGVAEGAVRLRLVGSCHSCPSSTQTMKQLIEETIYETPPDVAFVDVDAVAGPTARPATTFV